MASTVVEPGAIEDFLREEAGKELLRFTTAGSVDDGKSTLIGRLLYDSKGVYEDQLASVKKSTVNRSSGPIDFSLLTDGLKAEREQGITIDVAYRYFSTPRRKFIIADTPGHEQYTRNMATGASTAHLAIVLVDARKGVLPQSRRHAFIASLLGIPHVAVAINKMDLVDFRQDIFDEISREFLNFAGRLQVPNLYFLPISALDGDNVVERSARTPWYTGGSLLQLLETVPLQDAPSASAPVRFPVQLVLRPNLDFRGFAGTLSSGTLRKGDAVMSLPSGRTSTVKSLLTFDGELQQASAPQPLTVCLEDEIDVSRGDMLVTPKRLPHVSRRMESTVVWMHTEPLQLDSPYLLKHTTQQTPVSVRAVRARIDINSLVEVPATELQLNEIGRVSLETRRPLFFDPYNANRNTGCFVLIDPVSNLTVAAGMIAARTDEDQRRLSPEASGPEQSRLTAVERWDRSGHKPAVIWLRGRLDLAYLMERRLFDRGCLVHVLGEDIESDTIPELVWVSGAAGLISVCSIPQGEADQSERMRETLGDELFLPFNEGELPSDDERAADVVLGLLEKRGLVRTDQRGTGGDGI